MIIKHFWCLMLLSSLLAITYGYKLEETRAKRQIPADCDKPPMKRLAHTCCRLPKERIWGDLRDSLSKCVNKMKQQAPARQEMAEDGGEVPATMTPEGSDEGPVTEATSEPAGPPPPPPPGPGHRPFGHRPRGHPRRRPFAERVKETFTTVFNVIKGTFDILWQSVVMIPDHFRLRAKDECFMECVFEDQGFLLNNKANKEALIDRLNITLGNNHRWYNVAKTAVETCHQMYESAVPSNKTCQSGSEEIFRCVFKQIFFNCPTWPQNNEYCASLRDFYQKCPDGPPPDVDDHHVMPPPPPPEEMPPEDQDEATTTERESEE